MYKLQIGRPEIKKKIFFFAQENKPLEWRANA